DKDEMAEESYEPIQSIVVAKRIVMEEREALRLCGQGIVHRPLRGGMTPADFLWILVDRVLGIVDHEVGPCEKLDVALLLPVHGRNPRGGPAPVPFSRLCASVRLVIKSVHDDHTIGFQSVAQREGRVVHVVGDYVRSGNAELTFNQIMETDGRAKLPGRHREKRVLPSPV